MNAAPNAVSRRDAGDARPLVSVVMPVYNSERFLAEAVESMLGQTLDDFELIVVDDGSTDGSAALIKSLARSDERIQTVQLPHNRGSAAARNAGLARASGEYFTTLDSDDISQPQRLQTQVDFLRSHTEIDGVGVFAKVVHENLTYKADKTPPTQHALIMLEHFLGDPFVHASVLLPRIHVLDAGGYDESLRYSDDSDLMTRLMGQLRYANIPEFLYVYRRHPSQHTAQQNDRHRDDMLRVLQRRYERIWGEAPLPAIERIGRIKPWSKLTWRERRWAKRDIERLIDAMIAADWVDAVDRPLLIAETNRRLETVSPRLWQMFCHWYRYRVRRHLI